MLVWCKRKILLAGFSRTKWQWVTKHEAVCTCSRTAQCLFRMKHIGNYLHFPCFSQTKIMLMLNLRFVTKAVPQTVCSYILIHMTCHRRTTADKHQYSTLSSHHDLYSRALLNCWRNVLRLSKIRFVPSSKTFSCHQVGLCLHKSSVASSISWGTKWRD